jgi:hypothetical protein
MALHLVCTSCQKELVKPGALLFGPPSKSATAKKYHLCGSCYREIIRFYKLRPRTQKKK